MTGNVGHVSLLARAGAAFTTAILILCKYFTDSLDVLIIKKLFSSFFKLVKVNNMIVRFFALLLNTKIIVKKCVIYADIRAVHVVVDHSY